MFWAGCAEALDASLWQSQCPQTPHHQDRPGGHRLSLCLPGLSSFLFMSYVNSGVLLAGSELCFSAALWLLDAADLKLVHDDPDTHGSSETTQQPCRWRSPRRQGGQTEIYEVTWASSGLVTGCPLNHCLVTHLLGKMGG